MPFIPWTISPTYTYHSAFTLVSNPSIDKRRKESLMNVGPFLYILIIILVILLIVYLVQRIR